MDSAAPEGIQTVRESIMAVNPNAIVVDAASPLTIDKPELVKGKKATKSRKFFPGYMFIQMTLNDQTWHLVRNAPWVMGFIGGTSNKPAPVDDKEIDDILHRVQEGAEKPQPKILFAPGEVVRIINGPFSDFDGVVEDVNYEKSRLVVAVLIFGRSTPVDLEFGQVQKA
jgi:transcriptional antiterminator NusG